MDDTANDTQPLIVTEVALYLHVQGHSKFVARYAKQVRQTIEQYCLQNYGLREQDLGGNDYLLRFTHSDLDDLRRQIDLLLSYADSEADMYYCFIEVDIENAEELGLLE
ncbi:hypothetical protein [Adonisia turfae]|uniref:Uncharacterized protein n=1 Tax=Adonisia turfae CCMR0081 TaxID=2292702 RepID=A0A6M0RE95_9CYAN|nr:hypothetical protein [Adonisia turfae]NEZ54220.1 hypothetical protein [Adonisia turfae CCMR0081]